MVGVRRPARRVEGDGVGLSIYPKTRLAGFRDERVTAIVTLNSPCRTAGMRPGKEFPTVMLNGSTTQSASRRVASEASPRQEFLSNGSDTSSQCEINPVKGLCGGM